FNRAMGDRAASSCPTGPRSSHFRRVQDGGRLAVFGTCERVSAPGGREEAMNGMYYVFLIAVFFVYWVVAWRVRLRIAFLLAASCLFYAVVGGRALLILVAISAIDFTTTRLMVRR